MEDGGRGEQDVDFIFWRGGSCGGAVVSHMQLKIGRRQSRAEKEEEVDVVVEKDVVRKAELLCGGFASEIKWCKE